MMELLHHPSWESYLRDLEEQEKRSVQALISGGKDMHDYNTGFLTALRWCAAWPQRVIDVADKEAAKRG
jgi:hypothetical protein